MTPGNGANQRGGPGASYAVTGRLPGGALAWVVCQQTGGWVGRTRVWDKIPDGHWVSDAYVATPGRDGLQPTHAPLLTRALLPLALAAAPALD